MSKSKKPQLEIKNQYHPDKLNFSIDRNNELQIETTHACFYITGLDAHKLLEFLQENLK